jgi:hypothetical protein
MSTAVVTIFVIAIIIAGAASASVPTCSSACDVSAAPPSPTQNAE